MPTADDLLSRARKLRVALDFVSHDNLPGSSGFDSLLSISSSNFRMWCVGSAWEILFPLSFLLAIASRADNFSELAFVGGQFKVILGRC